jgi:hypothetical protein
LISPGYATDEVLSKFPTTVICVGDVDPLIDDSTYLFNRLNSVRFYLTDYDNADFDIDDKPDNQDSDVMKNNVVLLLTSRVYK